MELERVDLRHTLELVHLLDMDGRVTFSGLLAEATEWKAVYFTKGK